MRLTSCNFRFYWTLQWRFDGAFDLFISPKGHLPQRYHYFKQFVSKLSLMYNREDSHDDGESVIPLILVGYPPLPDNL